MGECACTDIWPCSDHVTAGDWARCHSNLNLQHNAVIAKVLDLLRAVDEGPAFIVTIRGEIEALRKVVEEEM